MKSQRGTRIANAHCPHYTLAPGARVFLFEEVLAPMRGSARRIIEITFAIPPYGDQWRDYIFNKKGMGDATIGR